MEPREIDPVRYGVLWQKVEDYERRFNEMDKKLDKMENQLEKLVAMANQGKGGLWFGISVISGVSVVVGYIINLWKH